MLYYTIGLPRSGKSTLCDKWVSYEMDINWNQFEPYVREEILSPNQQIENSRVIVCSDDIRMALHGCRFNSLAESMVGSIKEIMVRALLRRGFDVIVDGTHTTENSIKKILSLDKNAQYVYINTSAEKCKERARETDQEDLCPVIDRMEFNLEELCKDAYGNRISLRSAVEYINILFSNYNKSDKIQVE